MSKQGQRLPFDGMSTAPDVKLIRDKYPDNSLTEGVDIAAKEAIAEILHLSVDDHRFRTVTSAWRRTVERESGKVISLTDGVFTVLDDSGKLTATAGGLASAGRKIRRSRMVGSYVNRKNLNNEERNNYDRINFRMSKMIEADRLAARAEIPRLMED